MIDPRAWEVIKIIAIAGIWFFALRLLALAAIGSGFLTSIQMDLMVK